MAKGTDDREVVDKILENIRGAIERRAEASRLENVLELTEVVHDDLSKINYNQMLSDREIKAVFKEVLKPYLQSWLAQNLPAIAKDIIEAEVKALIAKNELVS